ncbi:hypothetical protein [Pseudonocardia xishanensis]|uniref:MFS transporter n=1 Tax=Pseudonocardia xishanensis TaxID=630995 RepID=A0ABP8RDL1_9PSEU
MHSHPQHPLRALPRGRGMRTVAVTVAALGTAVAGHVLGGAGMPAPGGIALAALALAAPGWWLARDERGWERLTAAQLTFQLTAHLLFLATSSAQPTVHGHADGADHGLVLIAHLVSAAVAGAWLRRGEQRARALSDRALRILFALVDALLTGTRPRLAPTPVRPRRVLRAGRGTLLRHAIVHRGPPLAA